MIIAIIVLICLVSFAGVLYYINHSNKGIDVNDSSISNVDINYTSEFTTPVENDIYKEKEESPVQVKTIDKFFKPREVEVEDNTKEEVCIDSISEFETPVEKDIYKEPKSKVKVKVIKKF